MPKFDERKDYWVRYVGFIDWQLMRFDPESLRADREGDTPLIADARRVPTPAEMDRTANFLSDLLDFWIDDSAEHQEVKALIRLLRGEEASDG